MKALSLSRPWPYTFLHLGKQIENRQRKDGRMPSMCTYRGPLLLHAAKSWDRDAAQWMRTRGLIRSDQMEMMLDRKQHQAGGIFARCRVVEHICKVLPKFTDRPMEEQHIRSELAKRHGVESVELRWWMGGYAIVLVDIEPTPFVPCRGHLGLWNANEDVLSKLEAA